MARLAEELRRVGLEAGLDAAGICDARPFEETRRALDERKAGHLSADMQFTYRNPRRSTDPRATLPDARALVVGARRYVRQSPPSGAGVAGAEQPAGRVARYSWTDHYAPLREALGAVARRLADRGWSARVVADDNALVDRAAAVRAGLGWYGKNSNVLLHDQGSWFVLGSVVTDAPLASHVRPDEATGCGSCRRCLDACPTGALVAPGVLDARRCLAWLLQAEGSFPAEFREALGDRLYGCDDCQEVCPVNRLAVRRDPPAAAGAGAQATEDILELLEEDDEQILAKVGRWYIPKRQPRYVRRNALIVLGNTADPAAPGVRAALRRSLDDRDPLVRSHAVWAAGRLGLEDLTAHLEQDRDPVVRAELQALRRPAAGLAGAGPSRRP